MSFSVKITFGIGSSPFGYCVIGLSENKLCHVSFINSTNDRAAREQLHETWPKAKLVRDDARLAPYVTQIFVAHNPLPLLVPGTAFQRKVWQALQTIPRGATANYADIARQIGSPRASRAVGTACGKNPIGFVIPCHRVIASNGSIGGYHWGLKRKAAILAWEAACRESVSA